MGIGCRTALVAAVLAVFAGPATALQTLDVVLVPTRDTTIFSDGETNASGAGAYAFAGTTAGGSFRRALFAFDLTGIAPGSQVLDAAFSITVDRTPGTEGPMTLHRLVADWGEGASDGASGGAGTQAATGDATWTFRFFQDDGRKWSTAGGDFAATASASLDVGGVGTYTWRGAGLEADVQAWIDAPETSFGWILIGDESVSRSAKRFYSAEAVEALAALRPTLRLQVAPVPEPATVTLGLLGAIVLGAGLRWRRGRR